VTASLQIKPVKVCLLPPIAVILLFPAILRRLLGWSTECGLGPARNDTSVGGKPAHTVVASQAVGVIASDRAPVSDAVPLAGAFLGAPTVDQPGDAVADAVAVVPANGPAAMAEITDLGGAALLAAEAGLGDHSALAGHIARADYTALAEHTSLAEHTALDEGEILDGGAILDGGLPGDGTVPLPALPVADRAFTEHFESMAVEAAPAAREQPAGDDAARPGTRTGGAWDASEAVTEIYAAHYARLVRLALLLVHDVQTAEEVVQDAFEAMHKAWRRLREEEKALAYLRQTVVNRSRSVLRHRKVVDLHPPRPAPDEPSAEHAALALIERSAVAAALRHLPERQREAIVLRYYADLSEADIARAMGISRGAVKSHTARAIASLKSVLGRDPL
jgi:RNA polymerase sigma-70 factor (sigma-E family)